LGIPSYCQRRVRDVKWHLARRIRANAFWSSLPWVTFEEKASAR
jgi:hypothetical protein